MYSNTFIFQNLSFMLILKKKILFHQNQKGNALYHTKLTYFNLRKFKTNNSFISKIFNVNFRVENKISQVKPCI